MSAKMEYKGTDVEAAIDTACAALNVAREELDIRIISTGSTGIFGLGRKKAAVQVSLKKEGGQEQKRPVAEKKASAPRTRPERPASERKSTPPKPRAEQPRENEEPEEAMGDPVTPEEMESIRADLARILDLMHCPSEINIEQDQNNKVHAKISGEFVDILVGPEGQTLDSLQYVMRKIITRKFTQKVLFSLDAGGFRDNRMGELQDRALRLAQEVKETGKTRTIPAINPAERRMVHMALQDDTEIRSRSVGEGLFKKVLIYLPGKGRRRSPRKKKTGEKSLE
ncbi:RNA-binding cell elongation regulator Jag/EloR [Thiovibrio frasassiensis]|uniref:RNA-binding protein KhpB n=1 Tax=Thiovibrio frasassiensis TaxID=2984131 RepID=A0A9X4MLW4_9BACT|nr:RNA-binding cell elongation regulator Jag/EloR [Thiovibrio frasassiensis]MDG4475232.1 Jag N-terminal domain-containing protein [Thiovibrio frasassiensis]